MMTVMRDGSPLRHSTRPIRRTQAYRPSHPANLRCPNDRRTCCRRAHRHDPAAGEHADYHHRNTTVPRKAP